VIFFLFLFFIPIFVQWEGLFSAGY
jgi:hypothetical protein